MPASRSATSRVRSDSPLAAALDRIGDRWSLLLIDALLDGPRRFGELGESLPGIAPNILTERLRRLEGVHILTATPYQSRPVRWSYALTAEGRDLASVLRLLADWGARTDATAEGAADAVEPLRHELCGTALETRWWCPTCAVTVDDAHVRETRSV